jgi:RNase P/RNase MRP subunit POP5
LLKRVKRRYLALEIDAVESCSQNDFLDALWNSLTKLYGEHGASQVNLNLVRFNVENKTATVRVNLASVDMMRAALACLTKIAGKPAAVHTSRVSGTLKACQAKSNRNI